MDDDTTRHDVRYIRRQMATQIHFTEHLLLHLLDVKKRLSAIEQKLPDRKKKLPSIFSAFHRPRSGAPEPDVSARDKD